MRPIDARWEEMSEGRKGVDILAFLPVNSIEGELTRAIAVIRLYDGSLRTVPVSELRVPPDEISKLRG